MSQQTRIEEGVGYLLRLANLVEAGKIRLCQVIIVKHDGTVGQFSGDFDAEEIDSSTDWIKVLGMMSATQATILRDRIELDQTDPTEETAHE